MVEIYTTFNLEMHATATVIKAYAPQPTEGLCNDIFKTINDDAKRRYGCNKTFEIQEWECIKISAELVKDKEYRYQIEFSVRGIFGEECAHIEDKETKSLYLRDEDEIKDDIDTIWLFPGFDVEFSNIFTEVME